MPPQGWIVSLCLVSSLLWARPAVAEEETRRRGTVQFDPLTAALGYWHLQFELALSDHHSVYASPHLRFGNALLGDDDFQSRGFEAAYRYYLFGTAPQGFWLQGRGVVSYLYKGTDDTVGGYLGGLAGYTWIFDDRWVLAAGAGAQYLQMEVGGEGPKGVFPALHTAFGLAF